MSKTDSKVKPLEILVYPEKCSGCLSCELACSYLLTGSFNPLKARIKINWVGEIDRRISFTDDCIWCGFCVDYCDYDALVIKK